MSESELRMIRESIEMHGATHRPLGYDERRAVLKAVSELAAEIVESDDSDQWPESLRIMREQRERIAKLEAKLADARHWSERHNAAAIRLGDTVCEQREQIAALEREVEIQKAAKSEAQGLCDQVIETVERLRRSNADNHHNAWKCPYCNPNGETVERLRADAELWRVEVANRLDSPPASGTIEPSDAP